MKTIHRLFNTLAAVAIVVSGASLSQASSSIADQPGGAFSTNGLNGWSERSFEGNTRYELVDEGGVAVLKGHTRSKASVLYREEVVDLSKTPVISWSWKIDQTYSGIDEKSRAGDDFPARLYVVVKTGFLPWDTLAINYVWSSSVPVGETWANPFTGKAKMVAVQSGDADVGKWSLHSRNIVDDFKTLFDLDADELDGYAVMVDGDNSKQEGTAWFGEINFSSAMP